MKVLVTGGAGYIGSHTIVELLSANHEVCVIDNFCNSSKVALDRVAEIAKKHFATYDADVRDKSVVDKIFSDFQPKAVIHFAGLKAVGESVRKPIEYYDVNVNGTICLLRAMQQAACNRIVFSSSATVYGEPQYTPIDETHPCAPTSPYGRTKLMAEQILVDWQKVTPSAGVVILRYFNPVGAHPSARIGENPRDTPNNLMPYIGQVAVGRQAALSVFGMDYNTPDGTGIRDYIHVTDLARAHTKALSHATDHEEVGVFNIGTGHGYSVLDVLKAFSHAAEKPIPYQIASRRDGDVACSLSNPARAHVVLGWEAEVGLEEMCASTWNWQSRNVDGYIS
jgi:UDP-glucose 4-epimerase